MGGFEVRRSVNIAADPFFGRLVSMDKLVGKDFERGLERLKAAAEA